MSKKSSRGCLLLLVVSILLLGAFIGFLYAGAASDWDWTWEDPLTVVSWNGPYDGAYTLSAEPVIALVTDPLTIRATGFAPNQKVGIRATTRNHDGVLWESAAVFEADANGIVDLTQQAPLSGSYEGVAPMGLFWSMRPTNTDGSTVFYTVTASYEVQLMLEAESETLVEMTVQRRKAARDIVRQEIDDGNIVGVFYSPSGAEESPAILVIGGSGGGIPELYAALFASHGYASLAIGYFGVEGRPDTLSEIPLEYFDEGLAWLKSHPSVDSDRIAIYGHSRGSEAALLTAVHNPDIAAVIAVAPSSVVWSGLDYSNIIENRGRVPSAWSRDGVPLPANNVTITAETLRALMGRPAVMRDVFMQGLETPIAGSVIPVEKIQAPILLISSTNDQLWPSTPFAEQIMARLKDNDFAFAAEHIRLEGAGHSVKPAWEPPIYMNGESPIVYVMGGSREANGQATAVLWSTQITFLNEQLGR